MPYYIKTEAQASTKVLCVEITGHGDEYIAALCPWMAIKLMLHSHKL